MGLVRLASGRLRGLDTTAQAQVREGIAADRAGGSDYGGGHPKISLGAPSGMSSWTRVVSSARRQIS
jgi:hypothetical protein